MTFRGGDVVLSSLSMTGSRTSLQRNGSKVAAVGVRFISPVLWLVSRPFVWSYRIADRVFAFDKSGAAANLKRLIEEVKSDCDQVFRAYGGRVLPECSEGSPYMDFATVVVEVRSLQLRASRDRGFTTWQISSPGSRYPWQPLDLVCQQFAPNERLNSTFRLLRDHLPQIEALFASASWIPPVRP
jgi:hypothetical protein